MLNEEIENNLKDSAEKITVKSFSERWENIKGRLTESDCSSDMESAVLVTPYGSTDKSVNNKKNLLIIVLPFLLCYLLVISIVLPLTLRKKEPAYYGPNELIQSVIDEEGFFKVMGENNFDVIDLSRYEIDGCVLLTAVGGEVKGGKIDASGEDFILNVAIYDETVLLGDDLYENLYTVGTAEIFYDTEFDGELYTTNAITQYKNIKYVLNLFSLTDNCTDIFDELFS